MHAAASPELITERNKTMNTVKVRNTVIGEGMPKICVPIVGVTKEAILEEAKAITKLPADVVEWRIDWFENVFDFAALEDVMKGLREILGDMPILMTFRTSKEGGEKAIEDEVYADINIKAAQTGLIDMVDVEVFTGDEIVKKIIEGAHAAGVKVVASNHDFFKTPEKDDIVGRLCKMQGRDATIVLSEVNDSLQLIYDQAEESEKYNFANGEKAQEMADGNTLLIVVDTHRRSFVDCPELLEKVK